MVMKTNIIYLVAFLGLITLNILPGIKLKAEEPNQKKWKQILCTDGVNFFEICSVDGDGNRCYGGGQTTRKCPGTTD